MNYKRTNNFVGDRNDRPDRQNQFQGPKISLDDIVNYIEKNKKFINNPLTEKLDMNDVHAEQGIEALQYNKTSNVDSLPTNLQSIFSSTEFIRAGSLTYVGIPANVDVSYASSLIMLMVPDFTQMKDDDRVDFVQAFIRKIHKESRESFTKFGYDKLGWDVKEFMNNVKNFTIGKDLLRYVADFLNINIFILDYEMDSLIYVGEKTFSKYKKNVLLLKIKENRFEPVFMRDALFINHKSFIIKKLMNSRFLVERLDCDFTNEKEEFNFVIGEEDLEKYIEQIADKTKKIEDDKNVVDKNSKGSDVKPGQVSTFEEKSKENDKSKDKSAIHTMQSVRTNDHDQESDDLNGFDQEDNGTDDVDNPDSGHLSDDQDVNSYDSDSNKFESEDQHSSEKNKKLLKNKKNSKIVALSDDENIDSESNHSALKKEIKKVVPVKDSKKEEKPSKKQTKKSTHVDTTKTVAQLKEIAKQLGIDLTYDKNGKKTAKTKPMLIDDINNN